MRRGFSSLVILLLPIVALSGCMVVQQTQDPPDERFGHRYPEETADGRKTVVIRSAEGDDEFFFYPVPFDTVHVRPAPFREGVSPEVQRLPVEVLVKGSFPDSCSELHDLVQSRAGHIIDVALRMRKERGAVCAAVVRPFRFYFMLPDEYGAGHYTLRLNNRMVPFQITLPPSE